VKQNWNIKKKLECHVQGTGMGWELEPKRKPDENWEKMIFNCEMM